jgi:transcriptional regulator with XRE-family HTH domain
MEITGEQIVQRIETLAERKALVRDLGIPAQTISNWKIRNNIPTADIILQIARYLHVSVEWLLTGNNSTGVTPEDTALLSKWRKLDDEGKRAVRIQIDGQLNRIRSQKNIEREHETTGDLYAAQKKQPYGDGTETSDAELPTRPHE